MPFLYNYLNIYVPSVLYMFQGVFYPIIYRYKFIYEPLYNFFI